ncbi:MAG: radical family heme chaperone HemW [Bacteroidota bacterium]|jgi:oxygen-independent coproporphyrinogen-3 oxidase
MLYKPQLVEALVKEMKLRHKEFNAPLRSVYLGGGTPSRLDDSELMYIMEYIEKHIGIAAEAEITLEANPDDLSIEKLRFLKSAGINRLSIGVQSFFEDDLRFMNRAHNQQEALNCIALAAQAGFEHLSIDLIYGTPGLSNERWIENLKTASALPVDHLSCYALTVESGTPLSKSIRKGLVSSTDEETQAQQFEILQSLAPELGWDHYEISNLSRAGAKAKHNSAYWEGLSYVGIGPSAHSFDGKQRRMNIANNTQYIRGLAENDCPHELEFIDAITHYNELILTGLRTSNGISKTALIQLGKSAVQAFAKARKALPNPAIILETETSFKLDTAHWLLADGIAASLFQDRI